MRQLRAACATHASAWWQHMLTILRSGPIWTLEIWLLLLLYPMLTRWSFAVFDCIPVRNLSYLRADPSEACYSARWWGAFLLALFGLGAYALGLPFAAYKLGNRYRLDHAHSARVYLLNSSYRDAYWYFESVDLLRKMFLAGMIVIAFPNSSFQLWLGVIGSCFALSPAASSFPNFMP